MFNPLQMLQSAPWLGPSFLLMASGGLMALLRNAPGDALRWAISKFSTSMVVKSDDPAYDYLTTWFAATEYAQRANRFSITTPRFDATTERPRFMFTPAEGQHFLIWQGAPLWISREGAPSVGRPHMTASTPADPSKPKQQESYFIRTPGRRGRAIFEALLRAAADTHLAPLDNRTKVYTVRWGDWTHTANAAPRRVFLPAGVWEGLLADCQWFVNSGPWYESLGIPYRRGYMLAGPPGTGKTATVQALAGELKLPLYILSLADKEMSDRQLNGMMSELPPKCILLIEDVDAAFHDREKGSDQANTLTFSGLLNALDGIAAAEGRLLFLTTNHPEVLDPALVRPGRVDYRLDYAPATLDQIMRLIWWFFPGRSAAEVEAAAQTFRASEASMAAVQTALTVEVMEAARAGRPQLGGGNLDGDN